jgi:hypothetical protein
MRAVELRREESRRRLEDLIRPAQLGNSFFNSLISAMSSLVLPGRTSPSIWARRSHLRSDSGEVIPSLPAIDRIASYSLP